MKSNRPEITLVLYVNDTAPVINEEADVHRNRKKLTSCSWGVSAKKMECKIFVHAIKSRRLLPIAQ